MSKYYASPHHLLYLIDELKVKGGTEKHLFELATGMAGSGFRVSVCALTDGAYADEFKNDSRIGYFCLNSPRIYDFRGVAALTKLVKYINSQNISILQSFHTASDLIAPLAVRLSLRNPKVISSRRDLGYTKSERHLKIQRIANNMVDGILANSQAVKRVVCNQEGLSPDRISVINNGINLECFAIDEKRRQRQRELIGINNSTILIGSVGNIRPVKGYDLLVKAAAMVCSQTPNVHFLHAGEGDQLPELKKHCNQLGIQDRFTFMGTVKDIPSFLNALDIYVQPSRSEGLSNAIIEAMAASLPVIATNVGGNPDLIDTGINGILTELNEEDIASQLCFLINEPEKRFKYGLAAHKKAQEKFNISIMLQTYQQLYLGFFK